MICPKKNIVLLNIVESKRLQFFCLYWKSKIKMNNYSDFFNFMSDSEKHVKLALN